MLSHLQRTIEDLILAARGRLNGLIDERTSYGPYSYDRAINEEINELRGSIDELLDRLEPFVLKQWLRGVPQSSE